MDSLTTSPVADVLERLFDEAEATDSRLMTGLADDPDSWRESFKGILDAEKQDYKGLYHQFARNFLNISPEFGRFLYICARARDARRIVEFGTSFGISTIHLAAAVRDNGGGAVISTELEPTKAARAREHLEAANLANLVEIRVGDALDTLRKGVGGPIDMVLLDGALSLYRPVLDLLEPNLHANALVIGENAVEESTSYLDYVRNPSNGYLSLTLPFDQGRGNELSLRTR
jgi:predicted O-methyltransferase YrrM